MSTESDRNVLESQLFFSLASKIFFNFFSDFLRFSLSDRLNNIEVESVGRILLSV